MRHNASAEIEVAASAEYFKSFPESAILTPQVVSTGNGRDPDTVAILTYIILDFVRYKADIRGFAPPGLNHLLNTTEYSE